MFLRNYDNIVGILMGCNDRTYSSTLQRLVDNDSGDGYAGNRAVFGDGNLNVKALSGQVKGFSNANSINYFSRMADIRNKYRIAFGSGTTAATYEDYKMETPLTLDSSFMTNFQITNYAITYDSTSKSMKQQVLCTVANSGSSAITISEWGMWIYMMTSNNDYDTTSQYYSESGSHVLLSREVLASAITIPANGSASFNLVQYIPMANHP